VDSVIGLRRDGFRRGVDCGAVARKSSWSLRETDRYDIIRIMNGKV